MSKGKILVIEDEKNLARFIELELRHEGYETFIQHNGRKGLELALNLDWDAILLDLMLPELNGIEICRRIRQVKKTPIIIMTARDSVIDRVTGLDHGADDYIVKPFAIEELLARLRSVLRRVQFDDEEAKTNLGKAHMEKAIVSNRDLIVEFSSRSVHRTNGEEIELTKKEYDVLHVFMTHLDEVLSRKQILEAVWGTDAGVDTNLVDVYIRYVRNKLDVPGEPSHIFTVRGVGYLMKREFPGVKPENYDDL